MGCNYNKKSWVEMATRVYKYGLIPIGYPPQAAIGELFRANNLWNTLVALHRESLENWDDARRAASIEYSEKMDDFEKLQQDIKLQKVALRKARMEDGSKTGDTPRVKSEYAALKRLFQDSKELSADLKPIRKDADTKIDKKALNDEYRDKCKRAVSVKNCKIYSVTAGQINANFRTARDKAFKDNATMRFHSFDGSGYFQFRCRQKDKSVKVDGISVDEFMNANFQQYLSCTVLSADESKKKPRLRISAKLTGGASKASKVFHQFDWIYHRPLPPDCQIQNGKILRTRSGDKFKYDLVLTVKVPDAIPINPNKLKGTIGIDIGFRRVADTVLIATIMSDDASKPPLEVKAPSEMVSALEHVIDLQSELDDAATDLGKTITPLLKNNPIPEEHQKYRMWRSIANRPANVTLSFEKAYKLAIWLNYEPDACPKDIIEKVHTWWRSYSRKYREIHNRRRKQLTHRKHFYRETAAKLVNQHRLIVLEEIDLRRFAETKDKDTKLSSKARAQRFLGAVSEFRDAIKNAADRDGVPYIEVNPAYTSKTCSECGVLNKSLKSEKEWACTSCGVVHDRDINAANNLQKMGKQYIEDVKKQSLEVIE